MVCFLPETVMRATLGTTSHSILLGAEKRDHHNLPFSWPPCFTSPTLGIFHKFDIGIESTINFQGQSCCNQPQLYLSTSFYRFCSGRTCWGHCLVIPGPPGCAYQSYQTATDSFCLGCTAKPAARFASVCITDILAHIGLISVVAVASHLHRNRIGWHSVSQNESSQKVLPYARLGWKCAPSCMFKKRIPLQK